MTVASSPARAETQDDRDVGGPRVRPQGLEQADAVELGHHHVAEHEVRAARARASSSAGAAVGGDEHVVLGAQQLGDVLAHVGVVVDDEHPRPLPRAPAAARWPAAGRVDEPARGLGEEPAGAAGAAPARRVVGARRPRRRAGLEHPPGRQVLPAPGQR